MIDYLEQEIRAVLTDMGGVPEGFDIAFEKPNNPEHGDVATNVAMKLAKHFKKPPRAIAEEIARRLTEKPIDPRLVTAIEVAGPGFINFRFAEHYLADAVARLLEAGPNYGRTAQGSGKNDIVEYVISNPTGPITVGHGRNAVLGATVGNL